MAHEMAFDTSISLGNVLTIISAVVSSVLGALVAFFRVKGRLDVIESSNQAQLRLFDGMQTEIKKISDLMIMHGRFDERLVALQREVTELRHGKGYVINGVPAE